MPTPSVEFNVKGLICHAAFIVITLLLAGCRSVHLAEFSSEPDSVTVFAAQSRGTVADAGINLQTNLMPHLQIGDVLTITAPDIIEPHEIHFRVHQDGGINIQSVGKFVAAGKTVRELHAEIAAKDPRYRKGEVSYCTCELHYSVTGEVNAPGAKVLTDGLTLSAALKASGGFTKVAARNSVQLIRSSGRRETIKLTRSGKDTSDDPPIYSGDTIEVKRRSIFNR